jgi:hypothetical protein
MFALPQLRWWARALQRSAVNGKDPLAESCRLLHLPGTNFGTHRGRREHENDGVSFPNQVAETSLPVLATGDAVAVEDALKAAKIEPRIELIGKVQVVAAVGDEDAKPALVGRVGSARLLRSYIAGFRRSWTGCVMRDVCHCTAPIAALKYSTSANWMGPRIDDKQQGNL